jgi:hypothetical protein
MMIRVRDFPDLVHGIEAPTVEAPGKARRDLVRSPDVDLHIRG